MIRSAQLLHLVFGALLGCSVGSSDGTAAANTPEGDAGTHADGASDSTASTDGTTAPAPEVPEPPANDAATDSADSETNETATRGATLPYDEYEAEDAETNAAILGPSRTFGDIAAESSGRRAVRLDAEGHYVRFVTLHEANAIVVRYVIPDGPQGQGTDATLGVYVDGQRRADLALTSRYAWTYGGEANSASNDPGQGGAHHFYDEARALVGDLPAGTTIELRKAAQDTAAYYVIDLMDVENVGPPLPTPAGALSIVDFGATADDGTDDGWAIQTCIDAARSQDKPVYFPAGTYHSTNAPLVVSDVAIHGAGMWYSTVSGRFARFNCSGGGCRYADFAILGETRARDDSSPDNGFNGGAGTGSRLENIWIEHTKCGYWVGGEPTDGLTIRGCRIRNTFADGVNLCNGASNSVVEQSHFRNTGDDAVASWSPSFAGGVNEGNVFRFNTVQIPWRANCYAIYGGRNNTIEDNLCADVVTYPGILVAQQYGAHPFDGTTVIRRNTLTRAGGQMFGQEHGALKLHAAEGGMSGFEIADIDVVDATYSGIQIQGPGRIEGTSFSNVRILGPGTSGILVNADATGEARLEGVVVVDPGSDGLRNEASGAWTFEQGDGNQGF